MPFHGRWPKASSHNAQARESVRSNAEIRIMLLVERLTIGSCAGTGSGSFFINVSETSGESATSRSVLHACQILNHGVTHTYLIVIVNRNRSFTGIASSTLTAKN